MRYKILRTLSPFLVILASLTACISITKIETTTPVAGSPDAPSILTLSPQPPLALTQTPTATRTPELLSKLENGLLSAVAIDSPQPGGYKKARLYLLDLAKESVIVLSPEGLEVVNSLAWSPGGDMITFSGGGPMTDEERTTLFVVDIRTSEVKGLKPEIIGGSMRIQYPTWSPEGDRIAFCGPCHEPGVIYVIDIDGSSVQRVTNGGPPSWSPDGNTLVFVRRQGMSLFGDIFVSDIWGNEIRQLTKEIDADRPVWSPDGQRIAFYGYDKLGERGGVFVMDADGSNLVQLADETSPPSWSPDGRYLLIASTQDAGQGISHMILINVTDGERIVLNRIPQNFFYQYAVFQPQAP